jgi:methylated-DNA-[protein]-cysteine S-methyltransferase
LNTPLIYFGSIMSRRLGRIWVARSALGLVAVEFGVSRANFERLLSRRTGLQICHAPRRVHAAAGQIREYLIGKRRLFRIKIDWSTMASAFQRAALEAVLAIPYGQTRTYAQIAREIGYPRAPRAVGRANATNPMPLVIPCHRVIGADGSLRGYGGAGGLRTKAWLLKMEASHAKRS